MQEFLEDVLELCCFEWFQNTAQLENGKDLRFRAVLFRMVPKLDMDGSNAQSGFRAVLFRMVPKLVELINKCYGRFRAVLFRMVPKRI